MATTPHLTNDQAARKLIGMIHTTRLREAKQALADGNPGDWLSVALDVDVLGSLSTGEKIMVRIVQAVWNGTSPVRLVELTVLDARLRQRVLLVLLDVWADR